MKVEIDREGCISCGMCAAICSEVFEMCDDDGKAKVYNQPNTPYIEATAKEASEACPVSVISVE